MCNPANHLMPQPARITHIQSDTSDTKTFRVVDAHGNIPFPHRPGQCAMLGVPGVGEAMFSIASSPTNTACFEFSIKAVGQLTYHLHAMQPDDALTIRGPFGRPFPVDTVLRGQDLLFVAGGIGIAPLRSVIRYVLDKRNDYGRVDIVYGARSAADLVYLDEIKTEWMDAPNVHIHLTIDRTEIGWDGHVGFVPAYIKELYDIHAPAKRTALICGPPVMIKYSLQALLELGFAKHQIYTTLEMRMKCGIGQCGRCNVGHKMVCIDGPVFRCDELEELPDEY
ncbi:MAG: FAD/NAD(P)-binding protein [Defluviitaleaceae bacterium]|nr:FAD/NAD(P)-binding protein [Defluviitaleaceae bacterium]